MSAHRSKVPKVVSPIHTRSAFMLVYFGVWFVLISKSVWTVLPKKLCSYSNQRANHEPMNPPQLPVQLLRPADRPDLRDLLPLKRIQSAGFSSSSSSSSSHLHLLLLLLLLLPFLSVLSRDRPSHKRHNGDSGCHEQSFVQIALQRQLTQKRHVSQAEGTCRCTFNPLSFPFIFLKW